MGQETVCCKALLYVSQHKQAQRHWEFAAEMTDSYPHDWDFSELTPARPANSGPVGLTPDLHNAEKRYRADTLALYW